MKKFLKNWSFIILLGVTTLLIGISIVSCTVMKTIETYQKYYPGDKKSESIADIYSQLKEHQIDSLSFYKWLTLQANNKDGYILQKSVQFRENDKTSWKFIYTKHVVLDSTFYSIMVLVSTKDRQLQNFYGR